MDISKIKRVIKVIFTEVLFVFSILVILNGCMIMILDQMGENRLLDDFDVFVKVGGIPLAVFILAFLTFIMAILVTLVLSIFRPRFFKKFHNHLKTGQCKACNKMFSLKEVKKQLVKEDVISILATVEDKDADGNVTSTHQQYIPGKRLLYNVTYKCKHCEKEFTMSITEDKKLI